LSMSQNWLVAPQYPLALQHFFPGQEGFSGSRARSPQSVRGALDGVGMGDRVAVPWHCPYCGWQYAREQCMLLSPQ
jgi:hypothetical protein